MYGHMNRGDKRTHEQGGGRTDTRTGGGRTDTRTQILEILDFVDKQTDIHGSFL